MGKEELTLYNFNLLPEKEQFRIVFNEGTFLDVYLTKEIRYVVYAVEKFFVEVKYDGEENKLVNKRAFKTGEILNKYSNIESYFKL